jgi:hypothetical protein
LASITTVTVCPGEAMGALALRLTKPGQPKSTMIWSAANDT